MLKRKDFRLCQVILEENVRVPFMIDFIVFDEFSLLEQCQHAFLEFTMQASAFLVFRFHTSVLGVKLPVVALTVD